MVEDLESLKTYFDDISNIDINYNKEEINKLIVEAQNGNVEARNTIVNNYVRFVISIAKRYKTNSVTLDDLIQEGNIGIIRAIQRFNPSLGYSFSTYAYYWVRQSITRYIADFGRTVRVPVHVHELLYKIDRLKAKAYKETGKELSIDEIAKIMNLSDEQKTRLFANTREVVSLNSPIQTDDGSKGSFEDVIPGENTNPEEIAFGGIDKELLYTLLDKLDSRSRNILYLRNGFYNGRIYTLEEIGMKYNLTRERIRQIEAKAMRQLKRLSTTMLNHDETAMHR